MDNAAQSKTNAGDQPAMSASRRVYLDLRQRIVSMQMRPGERIIERDIAEVHGTSRTPVHEAVQRLAEEGLIEIFRRVGTFVARIPLDQLNEAMLARAVLELAVVERACRLITDDGVAELRALIAEQEASVASQDDSAFHAQDERFHETLANISGVPIFWRLIQQAKTQIDRYRRLTLAVPGRMENVVAEHRRISEAVIAKDAEAATRLMREHLEGVLPMAEVMSLKLPAYFINHLPEFNGR
ncbi:Transcriptional regulator, GntR family [uncultured Pleomorphomonas sp.]|nr:GntR family transcriptional regulator [Pleomorphomonas carboxyditropha]SCM76244.1 Transcriptional regulator, GntR family [uncultured Pleomorphomonas sp.]